MAASKKKQHTVELTPRHVAEAIDKALYPFENYDENEGVTLILDLHNDLFKLTKATKFVSTREMNANKQVFLEDVQAALVPEYIRNAEWSKQSAPAITHEVIELEDQSDDGLFVQVKVRIHGMFASKSADPRNRTKIDYYRKVK